MENNDLEAKLKLDISGVLTEIKKVKAELAGLDEQLKKPLKPPSSPSTPKIKTEKPDLTGFKAYQEQIQLAKAQTILFGREQSRLRGALEDSGKSAERVNEVLKKFGTTSSSSKKATEALIQSETSLKKALDSGVISQTRYSKGLADIKAQKILLDNRMNDDTPLRKMNKNLGSIGSTISTLIPGFGQLFNQVQALHELANLGSNKDFLPNMPDISPSARNRRLAQRSIISAVPEVDFADPTFKRPKGSGRGALSIAKGGLGAEAMAGGGLGMGAMVGIGAGVVGVTALTVAATKGIEEYAKFEKQITRFSALNNMSAQEAKKYASEIQNIASQYSAFNQVDIAGAFTEITKAGVQSSDAIKLLPVAIDFAIASEEDLVTSSEKLIGITNAFNLGVEGSRHAADVLAQSAKDSSVGVGDLAQTMGYVGPIAQTAGQSLEEMSALSVVLGNNLIKGERAGTGLRSLLVRLTDPPREAGDALAKLGIAINDVNGNMLPLSDIIAQVRDKTDNLSESQKNQVLSQISGTEALSAFAVLVKEEPENLQRLIEGYGKLNGTSAEMARQMNEGLIPAWKGFQNQAGATIGKFGGWIAQTFNLAGALRSLTAALGGSAGVGAYLDRKAPEVLSRLQKEGKIAKNSDGTIKRTNKVSGFEKFLFGKSAENRGINYSDLAVLERVERTQKPLTAKKTIPQGNFTKPGSKEEAEQRREAYRTQKEEERIARELKEIARKNGTKSSGNTTAGGIKRGAPVKPKDDKKSGGLTEGEKAARKQGRENRAFDKSEKNDTELENSREKLKLVEKEVEANKELQKIRANFSKIDSDFSAKQNALKVEESVLSTKRNNLELADSQLELDKQAIEKQFTLKQITEDQKIKLLANIDQKKIENGFQKELISLEDKVIGLKEKKLQLAKKEAELQEKIKENAIEEKTALEKANTADEAVQNQKDLLATTKDPENRKDIETKLNELVASAKKAREAYDNLTNKNKEEIVKATNAITSDKTEITITENQISGEREKLGKQNQIDQKSAKNEEEQKLLELSKRRAEDIKNALSQGAKNIYDKITGAFEDGKLDFGEILDITKSVFDELSNVWKAFSGGAGGEGGGFNPLSLISGLFSGGGSGGGGNALTRNLQEGQSWKQDSNDNWQIYNKQGEAVTNLGESCLIAAKKAAGMGDSAGSVGGILGGLGGTIGNLVSSIGSGLSGLFNGGEGGGFLGKITSGLGGFLSKLGGGAKGGIKLPKIGGAKGGGAMNAISSIGDMAGGGEGEQGGQAQGGTESAVMGGLGAASGALSMAGPWGMAASAAIQVGMTAFSMFSKAKKAKKAKKEAEKKKKLEEELKKYEEFVKEQEEKINDADDAYLKDTVIGISKRIRVRKQALTDIRAKFEGTALAPAQQVNQAGGIKSALQGLSAGQTKQSTTLFASALQKQNGNKVLGQLQGGFMTVFGSALAKGNTAMIGAFQKGNQQLVQSTGGLSDDAKKEVQSSYDSLVKRLDKETKKLLVELGKAFSDFDNRVFLTGLDRQFRGLGEEVQKVIDESADLLEGGFNQQKVQLILNDALQGISEEYFKPLDDAIIEATTNRTELFKQLAEEAQANLKQLTENLSGVLEEFGFKKEESADEKLKRLIKEFNNEREKKKEERMKAELEAEKKLQEAKDARDKAQGVYDTSLNRATGLNIARMTKGSENFYSQMGSENLLMTDQVANLATKIKSLVNNGVQANLDYLAKKITS